MLEHLGRTWTIYVLLAVVGTALVWGMAAWWNAAGRQSKDVPAYTRIASYHVIAGNVGNAVHFLGSGARPISENLVVMETVWRDAPPPAERELRYAATGDVLELVESRNELTVDRKDLSAWAIAFWLTIVGLCLLPASAMLIVYGPGPQDKQIRMTDLRPVLEDALPLVAFTRVWDAVVRKQGSQF